jgi:hypothetical protein
MDYTRHPGPAYVEAPNSFHDAPHPLVFFAGGITGCPDWQAALCDRLQSGGVPGTILNPRRADFPIHDPTAAEQQIAWEFGALRQADVISFWFCKETLNPIVLLELGAALERVNWQRSSTDEASQQLVIGVEPGYARAQDVQIQSRLALPWDPPPYVNSLDQLATAIATVCRAYQP